MGAGAEAMETNVLIGCGSGRTEQRSQFASGLASQHVHLEEPLLGMNETSTSRNVFETASTNRRNSEFVPLDTNDLFQRFEDHAAVIAGNGRTHFRAQPKTGHQRGNTRDNQQASQKLQRRFGAQC